MALSLHETQKPVALDGHRFRVLSCGRRWGKTTLAVDQIKGRAAIPNSRIAYVAPTFQQARDIAWAELKEGCRTAAKTINESRLEITLVNNSKIVLRGWEAIETLRGQKFDLIVIDEVAMMRDFWSKWQEVIRPTLTDTKGEGIFISTPRGFNHFYDLYNLQDRDLDFRSFHFTTYDNPYIPTEEVDKARTELTEDRFAQEYLADFRKTEGLVYKEFIRSQHVINELPDKVWVKDFAGMDFGFTNPCAVIPIKKDRDRIYYVHSEYYRAQQTEAQNADYVSSCKFNEVYPDPESASGIEELKRRNVNVRDVLKNKDSIRNGINTVRELFKANRLFIHKDCLNLISELETYSYPEKRPGMNEYENPVKEHDHACFVAGTRVNGANIEDIGYLTGIEDVYEYTLGDEKVQSTPNHPVLTDRGFVHMDTLRYNDVIWNRRKLLFSTVSNGRDTQVVLRGLKGITTSVLGRLWEVKERDCIAMSGENIMERFLRDTTYTTLTVLPQITILLTLLVFTALNTFANIGMKKSVSGVEKISRMLLSPLQNGRVLQLVKKGVKRLANKMLITSSTDKRFNVSVTCVEKNMKQKGTEGTGSATVTVKPKHYVGRVPVYNLTTKNGMYSANGIMVSNCDALRYALSTESISSTDVVDDKLQAQFARNYAHQQSNSTK